VFSKESTRQLIISLSVTQALEETEVRIYWQIYCHNLENRVQGLQSKPAFDECAFQTACKNTSVIKVRFLIDNKPAGLIFATTDLSQYPESHYESGYFEDKVEHQIGGSQRVFVFLIGDHGGLMSTPALNDELTDPVTFHACLGEMKNTISNYLGKEPHLIINSSRLSASSASAGFEKCLLDPSIHDNGFVKINRLDSEMFVEIEWDVDCNGINRVEWALGHLGSFPCHDTPSLPNANVGIPIYRFKSPITGEAFEISYIETLNSNWRDAFYARYRKGLAHVARHSPQRLCYDESTFISYLSRSSISKYSLFGDNGELHGFYFIISRQFPDEACWISEPHRKFDAYVKYIWTSSHAGNECLKVLFAAGTRDCLLRAKIDGRATILADWSRKLNSRRFAHIVDLSGQRDESPSAMPFADMDWSTTLKWARPISHYIDEDVYFQI
jgi:hypothetical protein